MPRDDTRDVSLLSENATRHHTRKSLEALRHALQFMAVLRASQTWKVENHALGSM
jgi:hypothetical protein